MSTQNNINNYSYHIKINYDINTISQTDLIEFGLDTITSSDNQPQQAIIYYLIMDILVDRISFLLYLLFYVIVVKYAYKTKVILCT